MDENSNQSSTSSNSSSKNSMGVIIAIIAGIAIIILGILWYVNRSSIDQLSSQLAETKNQVADVQKEAQEAKTETEQSMKEGLGDVAGAIGDINNPVVRLALAKAYVAKIGATLDANSKEDLNTIVVYVEKNPVVLVKKPAQWPAEIQTAINNLKTKLAAVKTSVATTAQDAKDKLAKVGDGVNLQGTLEFVSDDSVMGGSVFAMTTDSGKKYFFEFNETTSEQIKDNMLGEEVRIQVKVTGIENGHVVYDVVSGPTLVTTTATPAASQSGTTTQ